MLSENNIPNKEIKGGEDRKEDEKLIEGLQEIGEDLKKDEEKIEGFFDGTIDAEGNAIK